jgi:hypothetical protein
VFTQNRFVAAYLHWALTPGNWIAEHLSNVLVVVMAKLMLTVMFLFVTVFRTMVFFHTWKHTLGDRSVQLSTGVSQTRRI